MAKKPEPKKQQKPPQQAAPTPKPEPVKFDGIAIHRTPRSPKAAAAWKTAEGVANAFSAEISRMASDERLSDRGRADDTRVLILDSLSTLLKHRRALDGERANIDRRRADLLPKAPNDLLTAGLHHEIRQHVRQLPQSERIKFVLDAVKAGDEQTVSALLAGPGYLSGLTDDVREKARTAWLEATAAAEVSRIADDAADLVEGEAALNTAENLLRQRGGLQPSEFNLLRQKAEAELAEQQRQAEAAAAIPTPAPVEPAPVSREQRIAEYADIDRETISALAKIGVEVDEVWLNHHAYDNNGYPVDAGELNKALAKLQASQKSEAA